MLQPLERRLTRGAESRVKTIPVPLKGWNTRDRYAENRDSILYAPVLTNFFINEGKLELVAGYAEHVTGLPDADVETLMEYDAGTTTTLFAGVGSEIYDVTSSSGIGMADVTGLNNARHQHTMFATTSGQHLCIVNGADDFRTFNGTSWTTRPLTNASASDMIDIAAHKSRLWFVQKNSMKAWYLATLGVQGALTSLDIGSLCKHGGSLQAIGTWTYDGGSGPDDYFVMVTSQGEVVIYAGTDPASSWTLSGIFKVDKPIGRRCLEKFGSDMVIFTESGPVLLSQIFQSITGKDAFADEIRDQFVRAASTDARNLYGWEVQLYSKRGWLICNIPQTDGTYMQFIYNTVTPGWFKMTGKPSICWHAADDAIYFGGPNGGVYRADYGTSDDGEEITGDYQPAWSRFGTSQKKKFNMVRPNFFTDGEPNPLVSMRVEYDDRNPTQEPELTWSVEGAEWDDGIWDEASWGGGINPVSRWITVSGIGIVGAPRIQVSTSSVTLSIASTDISFEVGGIL
jgi:hypothetical protein